MAWLVLAVLAVRAMWSADLPEPRCQPVSLEIARQQLPGSATGLATVDVSSDGKIVAFVSLARLSAADENTIDDVYVFDRTTAQLRLESVSASGGAGDGSSQQPRI